MKQKSFFAAFLLLFCATSLWASDTSVDGVWYDFDNTTMTASVTYGGSSHEIYSNKYTGDITIPESVTYNATTYSVTSIGGYAFSGCSRLTSVTIPNSVTSIGKWAFNGCSSLTSVTIPNSVTSIGLCAFYECKSLTSVTIPNSVTSNIGNSTFYECTGLTSVTIGNSVTGIEDYAFYQCTGLTSVTIGNSVTSIGDYAFYGCFVLTSVTIPNSVTSIGDRAFSGCFVTSVTIPNSVTSIGNYAFSGCSRLTSVTIPNSVTSIGSNAFSGCSSLTSVTIGNSVTSIGSYAFGSCSSLTSVTIPNSVTSIGEYAFARCYALRSVVMQCDTPPTLGNKAFLETNLSEIYVPCGTLDSYKQQWSEYRSNIKYKSYSITGKVNMDGAGKVTSTSGNICEAEQSGQVLATPNYGYHFVQWSDGNTDNPRIIELTQDTTFTAEFAVDKSGTCGDNNLLTWQFDDASKTLVVSGNGTLNSNYTFGVEAPTQTERLIIEEGVTSIGNNAFKDKCSTITTLALPSTVTAIGNYAFAGLSNRKFNTLVLPNTIISIGAHAFDGASYLQTIHFGSVLEEIGDYAFNGCTRVREMTCLAEITPNVGTDGLTSISDLAELYVPNDYLFDYQLDNNWKRFVLKPIGATEITVTSNDVTIVADENTATITWPTSEADSYTIEITKDGEVFCRLIFNANGQLTGIAFAPSRNGQAQAPAATMTANGMQFTVTGLNSGTNYGYKLDAKSGSATVVSYSGSFTTTGGLSALEPVESSAMHGGATKLLKSGQLLILRNGKTYTVQGQEVK